jgi:membrane fusion protein (multidrug efflux system)
MIRRIVIALVLVAAAAAAGAWWWRVGAVPEVTLVALSTGTAAEIVYASGTVEPRDWAKVTSLVTERIVETCDCEGDAVPAGHLLVRLDDSRVRATLGELDAQRDLAMRVLKRAEDLLERSVGSQQTFDEASSALARIDALRAAALKAANDHLITAPVPGQVLRLDASVGEIAQPGDALAYVGQLRPVEVVAEVNEEDIPKVETGQAVLIHSDAFAGQALEGTVGRITPMGDPVQRTYRVRITLPDDTPLFIGMSVDANIVIRRSEGNIVVPAVALAGDRVFAVVNNQLVARPVEVGIRGIETVEVVNGLKPGDRIVTPLPDGAKDGMRVREAAP